MIVVKQSGANTVATAQGVIEQDGPGETALPEPEVRCRLRQSEFISQSVNDVKNTALVGGTLAVLILLFFLRNVRSTLVVALSIPISIISTFALLYVAGFTLNTMSLGGWRSRPG